MQKKTDNFDFKGIIPESWRCVDCRKNTAPGMLTRAEAEATARALGDKWHRNEVGLPMKITADSELYHVHEAVWQAAGMEPCGGCLCIRCLEKRLGRELTAKDFDRDHAFNGLHLPGTALRADRLGVEHRRLVLSLVGGNPERHRLTLDEWMERLA